MEYVLLLVAAVLVVTVAVSVLLVRPKGRARPPRPPEELSRQAPPEAPPSEAPAPPIGPRPPAVPEMAPLVEAPPEPVAPPQPAAPELERPAPAAGRLVRLRSRLARSQGTLGRGLLTLLSRDRLDEEAWEEVEEVLLAADVGVAATREIVEALRGQVRVLGARSADELRPLLRAELLRALGDYDRTVHALAAAGRPAAVLVVGVNGTGKTTTCGKLARVLIAEGRTVVLGAADTFRAAAADQLATWAGRVGAEVVRGAEGADPASVAFDAARVAAETGAQTVVVDTAGRLHTKADLMDELTKIRRVVERQAPVEEVLLILDATTGQNGLVQAKVFLEAVAVTGVVLTKLDGTAKGGIVVAVQRELGLPVKLVGLGEGPDDLAPFEPDAFVDALIGDGEAGAVRESA